MEILCGQPTKDHATRKVIQEPELFKDLIVDMSDIIFIDQDEATSPEESIQGTPSPEPQTPSPIRCRTPEPESRGQASVQTHGPEP